MPIKKRLKNAIRARKWSQAEFARRLGLSAATVSDWINGNTTPTHAHLERAVAVLGMSLSEFYSDEVAA